MNRRAFLKWLGIGVPAAAVVAVVAPKVAQGESFKTMEARLGDWHNYHSEGDPELMKAIENWKSYPEHAYVDIYNPSNKAIYFDKEFMKMLKDQDALDAMAKRGESMPIAAHVRREFFRYSA